MTDARAVSVYAMVAGCLLAGCSESPSPQRRARGILPDEATSRATPAQIAAASERPAEAPATPPPSSLPSPFVRNAPNPGALSTPDSGASPDPAQAASATGGDAGPARDLSSELRALLGQPASCLDLAVVEAAGGKATIAATANVVPSGRITRASVTAPGQPATALRCLEQRITGGSLKGPVPGAPLAITTSVPIEVISTARP